jgi:hypothetical protein
VLFDVGIEDLRMLQYLGSECGERHFVRDFGLGIHTLETCPDSRTERVCTRHPASSRGR